VSWSDDINKGNRFNFGLNWLNFQKSINKDSEQEAKTHLLKMLGVDDFEGKTFIDIGCGSGLMSKCAYELGANVVSIDYDPNSVAATLTLANMVNIKKTSRRWTVSEASILDFSFLEGLRKADYVYCWGVAHHTGDMRQALLNISKLTKISGRLYISVYNDQGLLSRYWNFVKKLYCSSQLGLYLVVSIHFFDQYLLRLIWRRLRNGRSRNRGMTIWNDFHDWLGGYPFEVATPKNIIDLYKKEGYECVAVNLVGKRHGCNEFVFEKL
jgi:2-polyprenyl-3-methyl-5-hydroxy-6-metoxy-1,4-benzoquinol methylase